MSNCDQVYYGLQDNDGNLIGKDLASGGYPYAFNDTIQGTFLRRNKQEVEEYNKIMGNRFTLVQVILNVTPIK